MQAEVAAKNQQLIAEAAVKQAQVLGEQSKEYERKSTLKTGEAESTVDGSVLQNVSVDLETGVITIKGTKEEVERTKAILNAIQKSQQ